ncbi:MAG TPA: Gfo/Idh/MocA family oxidoreductase [Candidatus Polarisedimenticolia bacterium]|nr:Gfo/Idh/MocA family oxidoreductase [Candidatus Polarisedimenticolia bacterium]
MIGVGLMGRRHAENLARHVSDARLLAVTDANESARERVGKELGATASASVGALLERKDVRAVIVASPKRFHEEHAVSAAKAGKDVFLEKPIATSLEAADRVIAAARSAGIRLQVGFQRRYDPAYAEARKLVSGGALGRPLFYRGINRDLLAPVGPPGSMESSDILTESAIHDLDGARWMMADEVVGVRATLATIGDPATTPTSDLTMVELAFSRGAVAHIEALWGARYAYDIRSEILCENGAVIVGGFAQTMLTVLRPGERRDDLYPGFLERYADAYIAELRDFVGGVQDRRPAAVTGEDGRRALAIALAAERASATTRPVTPD